MAANEEQEIKPIPEPPGVPLIGYIQDFDRSFPLGSFLRFADQYGEIYQLRFPATTTVIASTHALINELCDEKRFVKIPTGALAEVRNGVHDGLFTARPEEPNWGIAHRILMPAFGPMSIRNMFDDMHDIATQLCMKWARYGPQNPIPVSDDFTRLALDTISLCSMGYRFNSYYTSEMHPFIEAMGSFLLECGRRFARPPIPSWFYRNEDGKYYENIEVMQKTAQEVLRARKEQGGDRKDLLQAMMDGVDPKTGQHMTDQSIIDNLITFLIAGHETTSGMLSFTFYQLLKHPDVYRKAQEEVDSVVGKGIITVEHVTKLPYIAAILREVLRLNSPISMFAVQPREDTLLGGKYPVKKGNNIGLFLAKLHLDPSVYGEDANEFKPERMMDEKFNKLPKNAWKPFGTGVRACIGRPFAWQEALLIMAMLLQNFNFVPDDPNYTLKLKQTLTIKPNGFQMRAILRDGLTATELEHRLAGTEAPKESKKNGVTASAPGSGKPTKKITILYGSNSGTCESLAQRVASDAPNHGFAAETVDCLDAAKGALPKDQPVVVITASYEGQPPDNAGHFVSWVENIKDDKTLNGVQYAVFGCGHHDWAQTFHRIPKLVDNKLEEAGAERLVKIGLSDAADSDIFTDFETWEDEILWPALKKQYNISDTSSEDMAQSSAVNAVISSPRANGLRQDVSEALVMETRVLTAEGEPIKKHVELKLPSDITYTAGDYLAVLPFNPRENVRRVMRHFRLPWDAYITLETEAKLVVPTNEPISAYELLSAYVELSQPATRRNILTLAEAAKDPPEGAALKGLTTAEEGSPRASVLDLLEKYPSINLPLGAFIAMLPPMRVRQYSISSSALHDPTRATLTFSILSAPSTSGQGKHLGVASNYLHSLDRGDKVHVAVRSSHVAFHLPRDPESVPIICVAAGTGLAPFRGFVQERAAMAAAGRALAPALLFFGCRGPGRDDLYAEELGAWERAGAVRVVRAYSRAPELAAGARYVQDAIALHAAEFRALWARGAKMYLCGSRAVGKGVRDVCVRLRVEEEKENGRVIGEEEANKWWEEMRNVRYATDVFD